MARTVTELEKRVVDELYRTCGGIWADILKRFKDTFKDDPRFQNQEPTVDSLQKIHRRYVRGLRDTKRERRKKGASIVDSLQVVVASHIRRVKQLEARERRLKIELGSQKIRIEELEEDNRNLRAENEELRAGRDPRRAGLRVVGRREVFVRHSDPTGK